MKEANNCLNKDQDVSTMKTAFLTVLLRIKQFFMTEMFHGLIPLKYKNGQLIIPYLFYQHISENPSE